MMMYHDNPRLSVHPDFRAPKLTERLCQVRARGFVREFIWPGQQWNMRDMRNWCTPAGYYLPETAVYSGPATINDIASFLHANLRRHEYC